MDLATILTIAGPTALIAGGAAYGSARQALNGTRERVKKIEEEHADHRERLARIETKLDLFMGLKPPIQ